MTYQLVLQWRGDNMPDYDELIGMEDNLTGRLGSSSDVDGHDTGRGECNIFILTEAANECFAKAFELVGLPWTKTMLAGFRNTDEDLFTPVWPTSLESFEVS